MNTNEYRDLDRNDVFDCEEDVPHPEGRHRDPWAPRKPAKSRAQIMIELAEDPDGLEAGFETTYRPSRYEQGWLLGSLRSFYEQALIRDVLSRVRGGKEASVYCCAAHPATGVDLLAVKVYRPRRFRSLSNDAVYKQGRVLLTDEGRAVKTTDHRIKRAVGKKSAFGLQVAHTSWLMYEYTTLQRLYERRASVPRPWGATDNAILMGYCGADRIAAPTLSEVTPDPDEVLGLYDEVFRNVALMLDLGLVHGDLSPYNILYWAGEVTLIDFPQVVDAYRNGDAWSIFQRDIARVCAYFGRHGVADDPDVVARDLWETYVGDPDLNRVAESAFDGLGI